MFTPVFRYSSLKNFLPVVRALMVLVCAKATALMRSFEGDEGWDFLAMACLGTAGFFSTLSLSLLTSPSYYCCSSGIVEGTPSVRLRLACVRAFLTLDFLHIGDTCFGTRGEMALVLLTLPKIWSMYKRLGP